LKLTTNLKNARAGRSGVTSYGVEVAFWFPDLDHGRSFIGFCSILGGWNHEITKMSLIRVRPISVLSLELEFFSLQENF